VISHGQRKLVRMVPNQVFRRYALLAIDPLRVLKLLGIQHDVLVILAIVLAVI
jgi:hypothetical protein